MREFGAIFSCVLVGLLVAWLIVRARFAESRSGRLGLVALAVGIVAYIPCLLATMFADPSYSSVLAIGGTITLFLAATGVGISIWAWRVRRRDKAGALALPVFAFICGMANLCCGLGAIATGSGRLASAQGTPWTWKSESDGFEITLPTEHWKLTPQPNVVAYFTCPRPYVIATIARVYPAATDAEFEKGLSIGKKIKSDSPTTQTIERTGTNSAGHPYWLFM